MQKKFQSAIQTFLVHYGFLAKHYFRIAASCDRGTAAWQVPLKVCSKFALAHHLILKGWIDSADDE